MKYIVTHKESLRLTIGGKNARYKSGEEVDVSTADPNVAYFIKRGFLVPVTDKTPSKKAPKVVEPVIDEEVEDSTEEVAADSE